MLRKMIFCFLGTMSIACAAEGDAFEQGTVKDIEYRQNIFKSIKAQIQNIGMVLKSEAGTDADLSELSAALHAQAKLVEAAFKKETQALDAETKAKNAIWTNFDDFKSEADNFVEITGTFYKKAQENEKISLKDFKSVVGSCKSCHKDYKD